MGQKIQIISAPSILGLRPEGVEHLAAAVLATGRLDKLKPIAPLIEVPTLNDRYSNHRDPATHCLNPAALREFSERLMTTIAEQIEQGNFPIVLGGDCSILLGIMPALKTKGRFGLIFLDAHADFYAPLQSTTGEVADMDLAMVTGRGPDILTDIGGLKPYVGDRYVIQIGQRDAEEAAGYGSQNIAETDIRVFDFNTIRAAGVDAVLDDVIARMDDPDVDGFWIHFDTDVISDDENPAVDYRLPGGIYFKEAKQILSRLVRTGRIAGISVTVYNPRLDKSGEIAMRIADCLIGGLSDGPAD